MDSRVDRRQFLRHGLTLAGGALLLPVGNFAFGNPSRATSSLPNERVLELIAAFARNVTFRGASAAAIVSGRTPIITELRAEITNFAAFSKACSSWRAYDLELVQASGSTLAVRISGDLFEIEALPADEFARASASAASTAVFAHDALSLAPGAKRAVDPLQAGDKLRLIRQASGATALGDILRGQVDAAEAGLAPDAAFVKTESALLAGSVSDSAAADGFARTFFSHITALANALPAPQVEALATSRLISSALQVRLGVSVESIVRSIKRPASMKGQPSGAAAHWLAGGLAAEIQADRGPRWIATNSIGRLLASTAALAEAQNILAASSTKSFGPPPVKPAPARLSN